jgi:hypothetical protein
LSPAILLNYITVVETIIRAPVDREASGMGKNSKYAVACSLIGSIISILSGYGI